MSNTTTGLLLLQHACGTFNKQANAGENAEGKTILLPFSIIREVIVLSSPHILIPSLDFALRRKQTGCAQVSGRMSLLYVPGCVNTVVIFRSHLVHVCHMALSCFEQCLVFFLFLVISEKEAGGGWRKPSPYNSATGYCLALPPSRLG